MAVPRPALEANRNRPNSVLFLDLALDSRADRVLLGEALPTDSGSVCLRPSEIRALFSGSTSSTMTFHFPARWETILPGWTFFFVQLISEGRGSGLRWPGSSSDERTIVGDVGQRGPVKLGADRILRLDCPPTESACSCFMAEADAVALVG